MARTDPQRNERFRVARARLRLTRQEVADAANQYLTPRHSLNDNDIGKIERGVVTWPGSERRAALKKVLGAATDADLGFVNSRATFTGSAAAAERIEHLARSADSLSAARFDEIGVPEGTDPLAAFAAGGPVSGPWLVLLDNLASIAENLGWNAVRPLAAKQMQSLEALRRQDSALAEPLAVADARWSEFMSWICANNGVPGDDWLRRAHHRAEAAGDAVVTAYVLMRQSQQALDAGDPTSAVALSRKALRYGPLPTRTQALCLTRLAEGLALAGNESGLEALEIAHHNVKAGSTSPEDHISRHCDTRYIDGIRARCHYLLGNHHEAAALLTDVLADEQPAGSIDRGIWYAYFAETHAPRHPEKSAEAGLKALALSRSADSARVTQALLTVAVTLRAHRGLDLVDRFLQQHSAAVAAQLSVSESWT
ncbi:transcriptional regulator with XRE-family HTH domain [Actinoplanes campanulatus]|uniref:Transcriptional regulator with XRE-family HTH domain n=1 Tax=Actinoplanes campanulatus TaxID=113559 RepID=A0A7W5AK79_9ACTN|nr:hypothetical protein [Actinoplanes campanulatus]MBB3097786.1 transcriptional regulator with XRE-family HTH domain [Actinoplanes campanulatus]GGN38313.1 hypothetical protein GCM10010109_65090 [Actinoplanes campanulatus]GID39645.1 hypothetical protein Aca09nite_61510 [Actinoplanes campanulatus]